MNVDQLSDADHESIRRAGQVLHERGWRAVFTLDGEMSQWLWLVDRIERGYLDLVDEYTNDLACRDWIHLVWPMVTDDVRSAYIDQLQAIDQRFAAATLEDGGQALSSFYRVENKSGWWWRRRPARVVGAMARAFRMADEDEVPPDRLVSLLRGDSESEVACRDLIRAGAKCVLHARDPARIDRLIESYSRRLRHAKRAAAMVTVGLEEAIVALGASDEDQVLLGHVDDPADRWHFVLFISLEGTALIASTGVGFSPDRPAG
jgi:hypothetical protein